MLLLCRPTFLAAAAELYSKLWVNSNSSRHCTGARNHTCIMLNAPGNMIYLLPEKPIHDQRCCYILARSRVEDGGGGGCE